MGHNKQTDNNNKRNEIKSVKTPSSSDLLFQNVLL